MLLPRYRVPTTEPTDKRRFDTKLRQLEVRDQTITAEVETLAPLDTIDQHRRGIPLIAQGIPGTSPGTDPLFAYLRKEGRRRYTPSVL